MNNIEKLGELMEVVFKMIDNHKNQAENCLAIVKNCNKIIDLNKAMILKAEEEIKDAEELATKKAEYEKDIQKYSDLGKKNLDEAQSHIDECKKLESLIGYAGDNLKKKIS